MGVVIDWSDAEAAGLKLAVGEHKAAELLKGCKVHWQRSCQRIANRIASSKNKQKEKEVFLAIANQIQKQDAIKIVACFETLCGVRTVNELVKLNIEISQEDADYVDMIGLWLNTGLSVGVRHPTLEDYAKLSP